MNYMIFLQAKDSGRNCPPIETEISVATLPNSFKEMLDYWRGCCFIFHNIKELVIDTISYKLNKYKEIHYTYESWCK